MPRTKSVRGKKDPEYKKRQYQQAILTMCMLTTPDCHAKRQFNMLAQYIDVACFSSERAEAFVTYHLSSIQDIGFRTYPCAMMDRAWVVCHEIRVEKVVPMLPEGVGLMAVNMNAISGKDPLAFRTIVNAGPLPDPSPELMCSLLTPEERDRLMYWIMEDMFSGSPRAAAHADTQYKQTEVMRGMTVKDMRKAYRLLMIERLSGLGQKKEDAPRGTSS